MIMSIENLIQKYNMAIGGVLHIGAHFGEELEAYKNVGIRKVWMFEPAQSTYKVLEERAKKYWNDFEVLRLTNIALGETSGIANMYTETANAGQSSSILEPAIHTQQYPGIVFNGREDVSVCRLDDMSVELEYNFMNMDVQGYELMVLKGSINTLEHIDYVYTEVNRDEVYKNCARIEQLDEYLKEYGFERVETDWMGGTWGDAFYIKHGDKPEINHKYI